MDNSLRLKGRAALLMRKRKALERSILRVEFPKKAEKGGKGVHGGPTGS